MVQTNRGDRPRVLVVGSDPVAAVVARSVPEPVQFVGPDARTAGRVPELGVRTVCSATNVGEALGEACARAAETGE